jgi:hypothetical protein
MRKYLSEASADVAGVQLSDKILDCIEANARKNAEIRASMAGIFVQDAETGATTEARRRVALDCGLSDADMAKFDAA